jgi:hypothetical protein
MAMRQTINDIQERLIRLQGVPETLGVVQANLAVVQARLLNESIRRRNARALSTQAAAANDAANRLIPLNKEVRGLGAGLPGARPIPAFPAIEVGDTAK